MIRWVVDSSPLIFLAKLDRLDLLREGADEILAPPAVLQEVRSHPDSGLSWTIWMGDALPAGLA